MDRYELNAIDIQFVSIFGRATAKWKKKWKIDHDLSDL